VREFKNLNKNSKAGLKQLSVSSTQNQNKKMKDFNQDQKLNYNFGGKECKQLQIGQNS
jgi:hypothetical protein